jgi:hypothetical protein
MATTLSHVAIAAAPLLALVFIVQPVEAAIQSTQTCHATPQRFRVALDLAHRDDVRHLPVPLKSQLIEMALRPHTYVPMTAFAEADKPSQLFQYYLLDTKNFQPSIFTATFPGVNDGVGATAANAANCGLPTTGAVRVSLEPKPGLPTDPNNPGAFIDMWTDISNLFVINSESGWYEGWMIHDLTVAAVAAPRASGRASFGTLTTADAAKLATMGTNNVPGHNFTLDGKAPQLPAASDVFPQKQSNLVPIYLSLGTYNCTQQSDCHSYWEFNQYTDWVSPLYELPTTGGFPDDFGQLPDAFDDGEIGAVSSLISGSGPNGVKNTPQSHGDDPNHPRDPDRALNAIPHDDTIDEHKETRLRFIPSGLANEILLDVYERPASFEPTVKNLEQRLYDAYAYEVSLVDANGDGVVDFVEGDLEGSSDGGQSNDRLYLPATQFNRVAVTREINDGLLAPRFSPSQRAWVLSGTLHIVSPAVPASVARDGDDR